MNYVGETKREYMTCSPDSTNHIGSTGTTGSTGITGSTGTIGT